MDRDNAERTSEEQSRSGADGRRFFVYNALPNSLFGWPPIRCDAAGLDVGGSVRVKQADGYAMTRRGAAALFGLVGSGPLFHTRDDRVPLATRPAILTPVATGVRDFMAAAVLAAQ